MQFELLNHPTLSTYLDGELVVEYISKWDNLNIRLSALSWQSCSPLVSSPHFAFHTITNRFRVNQG